MRATESLKNTNVCHESESCLGFKREREVDRECVCERERCRHFFSFLNGT